MKLLRLARLARWNRLLTKVAFHPDSTEPHIPFEPEALTLDRDIVALTLDLDA